MLAPAAERYVRQTTTSVLRGEVVMRLTGARVTTVIALLMLSQLLSAGADPEEKVRRVGLLGIKASDPAEAQRWEAFRFGLRERGWIEGENISLEYRWTDGNSTRLPELVADLVRLKVDVILARSSIFVKPAQEATSSIPIVFVAHADPVSAGHVASLAKPGGNTTGLTENAQDTEAKRLDLLKAADPRIKRVAVLWDPDTPSHPPRLRVVEEAARTLRLQLQVLGARTRAELEDAFSSMAREQAQAVLVLSSALVHAERQHLTEMAMRHRLPTMFLQREPVEAGGLMSYGPDHIDLFRRGAIYVDKILRGARPADLPVEQATKFELAINLKTAKALGLRIPQSLVARADQVIQ
jgi:putative ABC transport system substrate-binding protein